MISKMQRSTCINAMILAIVLAGLIYYNLNTIKYTIVYSPTLSELYMKYFRDGKKVDEDHVISSLDNKMKIILSLSDPGVSRFTRIAGRWDCNESAVLDDLIKPHFTAIEVGANFGVNTLRIAKHIGPQGHIHAFEANQNIAKYLKQSLELNNITDKVTVYEKGVGNTKTTAYLTDEYGSGHITKISTKETLPIHIVTLDDTLKPIKINLLKIDAEGYEAKIIEGATSIINNSPELILMIEWFPEMLKRQGSDPQKLLTMLEDLGFKSIWRVATHVNSKGRLQAITAEDLQSIKHCDLVFTRENISPLA